VAQIIGTAASARPPPSSRRATPSGSSSGATSPGDLLEHGETIDEAVRREVFEGIGLKIEPGALTGVYQNIPRNIFALVYTCHAVDVHLTTNDEGISIAGRAVLVWLYG
jgi:ADP-ribose pyrophosphatase YjhB (NUDIX family)